MKASANCCCTLLLLSSALRCPVLLLSLCLWLGSTLKLRLSFSSSRTHSRPYSTRHQPHHRHRPRPPATTPRPHPSAPSRRTDASSPTRGAPSPTPSWRPSLRAVRRATTARGGTRRRAGAGRGRGGRLWRRRCGRRGRACAGLGGRWRGGGACGCS
ncbi:hypothetical protein DFJ73DRAFT_852540 [Zopfochytrium polystomum]|nr:hypothetical protein DFJ73DRAFT_852540 [Zopfochytrium polystomum]